MSLENIISLLSSLEESYYNVDLSIYESPDIKSFFIQFPIVINKIKNEINNLKKTEKPIDIDYINLKQLDILSKNK